MDINEDDDDECKDENSVVRNAYNSMMLVCLN